MAGTTTQPPPGSQTKNTNETKKKGDETPEEKADREIHERDAEELEKRKKLVDGFVNDLQKRVEEYGVADLHSILDEVQWKVAHIHVNAAGADMGVRPPQEVKELTEEHTPYISPPPPFGQTMTENIAFHVAEMDEETKSRKKSKKAA